MSRFLALTCSMMLYLYTWAAESAGAPDLARIWNQNRQAVVKLVVTGFAPAGEPREIQYGVGSIVLSKGTIITALHVVGRDEDWKRSPDGEVQRSVEVFGLDNTSVLRSLGIA